MGEAVSVATRLVWIAAILALGSCESSPPRTAPPVPARDFLIRGVAQNPEYGAYGYLVFTRRAPTSELSRYITVCEAFGVGIESVDNYLAAGYERSKLMVTFWPLDKRVAATDCESLVAQYDYATAQMIASAVQKLDAAGPLLVAWDRPWNSGQTRHRPLVIDLSDCSNEDLLRAFGIWKDRIVRESAHWNEGFNLVLFREAFRNLIQKYGEIVTLAFTD